jgi:hypothetical protein
MSDSDLCGAGAVWHRLTTGSLAVAIAGLGALAAPPAAAQVALVDDLPPRFEWSGWIGADFRTEFKTKTDGGDSFETWGVGVAGDFGGPINESILLGLRAGYRYTAYDFRLDNPPGVPSVYGGSELPRDPWGALNTLDLAPNMTILVGDRISVVAAVPIRWSAENGARKDAMIGGISAIARWQITDAIRLGAGVGVTSQLEDDAETFPIVSAHWEMTDSLALRTEGSWIQGGRAMLLWGPNPAVRLSLSAGYERNRFRLDDNGAAPDRNGIGEVTAVPVEVGLRLRLYEGAYLDASAGLGVAGRFRVETDGGRKLYEEDYDPAPRISLGLRLPFGLP